MQFIAENYNWWRAGHIIFVIFWMAGLMMLPRLFVYQWQTKPGSDAAKTLIYQQGRLLHIILHPSVIGSWVFGILLLLSVSGPSHDLGQFLQPAWICKLSMILIMTGIHFFYAFARAQFAIEKRQKNEKFWRMFNEVPAILAIGIVITAVVFL